VTPKLHELLPVQPAVCTPCPPIQAPTIPLPTVFLRKVSWLHASPPNPTTFEAEADSRIRQKRGSVDFLLERGECADQ